jgi:hypothetical protein
VRRPHKSWAVPSWVPRRRTGVPTEERLVGYYLHLALNNAKACVLEEKSTVRSTQGEGIRSVISTDPRRVDLQLYFESTEDDTLLFEGQ